MTYPKDYWLNTPGEFVRHDERRLLYELAECVTDTFGVPTIVNIGVSLGATVHCLHAGAPDARLIGIDINLKTNRPLQGIEWLGGVEFVEAESCPYGLQFDDDVHLLFVDGGHSYNDVKEDIYAWLRWIPLGGIVAFHDYAPVPRDQRRLIGVKQAIDGWRESVGDTWVLRWSADSIVAYQRVK